MTSIKTIKTIFLYLFVLNLWGQNYQNFLGSVGSFYTPTARFHEEGSLSLSLARDELFSRGNLLAQPYDWLEVSIFYADIPNKSYSASLGQSYKDKGFNAKILVSKENNLAPQIAIGLSDFAGTGLFAGEYIVGSKKIQNFDLSLGMGWGVYGGFETFKNPFRYLDSKYKERNYNYDNVGELDEDDYFSGDRASLFASLAYTKDFGTLVAEFSELTLSQNRFGSSKKSPKFHIGYKSNLLDIINFSFFVSEDKQMKAQFEIVENFSKVSQNQYKEPSKKLNSPMLNLINVLQTNDIALKELYLDSNNNLVIGIRQNQYNNVNKSNDNTLRAIQYSLDGNFQETIIKNYYFGEEISSHAYNINTKKEISHIVSSKEDTLIYRQKEEFPKISYNVSPSISTMVASRESFLYYGLLLDLNLKVFFSENLYADSKFSYALTDNFDALFLEPVDTYPAQVRSDIKKYLNNYGDGVFIERLQANYLKKFGKSNFLSLKGGVLERMFSGFGFEYLNLSKHKKYAYGIDLFHVKKRDYSLDFSTLSYKTITGHINFYHFFDDLDLTTHISYGKYLAGDKGFTFDFSRRFSNGTKFGAFFTLTDVSSEQFGEGSFDKGIYISIPIKAFGNAESMSSFLWRPLTKDPGQKLNLDTRLYNLVERYIF